MMTKKCKKFITESQFCEEFNQLMLKTHCKRTTKKWASLRDITFMANVCTET